jgi:tetratricopeptide (TPR) repeat protein
MKKPIPTLFIFFMTLLLGVSCKQKNTLPADDTIRSMNLKRGEVVMCSPPGAQFGTVAFETSCSGKSKKDFDLAIALLHSFEYDEAEKVFAKIIDEDPACAMAYWGVAMCNYHQVWPSPPSRDEIEKGSKAISIAQSLKQKTERESRYIDAIAVFYKDAGTTPHKVRAINFCKEMEKLYKDFPDDKEAAIFYSLSLVGSADASDKTYANQKKAGTILTSLYPGEPDHPGIVHYIIHTYDYPELASLALPSARKYASIAPASAHAQHMPSHIFTRLGLWDECIRSNLVSTASAKCYAENAGLKGHWDEELHGMDYLVYAYLQKGENDSARQQYEYLKNIKAVSPVNFKVAYAYAAIPSRYFLENKMWKECSSLIVDPPKLQWNKFPWQEAIIHFTRLLGSVHVNNIAAARLELKALGNCHDSLMALKDNYKANQVMIQAKTGEAWILFKENKIADALQLMNAATDMEDNTEKSPVTPGEVIPARELLADMYMQLNKYAEALSSYEADLKKHPNRFNSLYNAALASEKLHDTEKANYYYGQLLKVANSSTAGRAELVKAKAFIN